MRDDTSHTISHRSRHTRCTHALRYSASHDVCVLWPLPYSHKRHRHTAMSMLCFCCVGCHVTTCTHAHMLHTCTKHMHTHMRMHIHTCTCTRTRTCAYAHAHAHAHAHALPPARCHAMPRHASPFAFPAFFRACVLALHAHMGGRVCGGPSCGTRQSLVARTRTWHGGLSRAPLVIHRNSSQPEDSRAARDCPSLTYARGSIGPSHRLEG